VSGSVLLQPEHNTKSDFFKTSPSPDKSVTEHLFGCCKRMHRLNYSSKFGVVICNVTGSIESKNSQQIAFWGLFAATTSCTDAFVSNAFSRLSQDNAGKILASYAMNCLPTFSVSVNTMRFVTRDCYHINI